MIQKHSGWMMEWTAHLHTVFGLVLAWEPLREIVMEGVWNSVNYIPERQAAVWFLGFGALIWMLGRWMRWLTIEKGMVLPRFMGWQLLAVSVAGIFLIPLSGFWLVIPQAVYLLRRSHT